MTKLNTCVFGATGGIGAALVSVLRAREDVALVHAGARRLPNGADKVRPFIFDLTDERSIAEAALGLSQAVPHVTIVATGALSFSGGGPPERSLRAIDPLRMGEMFALNAIGPALIAKHVLPLLPRDQRCVFAFLSARVGSLGDNKLGGWHSYRASKATLNMLMRNFAIELRRTHPQAIVAALHPGTVDTALSRPFQPNLPDGQLTSAQAAAEHLLDVIDNLGPAQSGAFLAWDGQPIPF